MLRLLRKEFTLSMHPTALIFLGLSALLLIPNYPYYVTFFYTTLGIFFTCLSGRENRDVFYSVCLPVKKRDVVGARILFAVILEMLQFVTAAVFAVLRQNIMQEGNAAGMDANITLFAFSFVLVGIFNLVFFTKYYRNVLKVGSAFVVSSIVMFIGIIIFEALTFAVPFVRDCLDTPEPKYIAIKLVFLALGAAVFAVFTLTAYKKSVKSFEALDL